MIKEYEKTGNISQACKKAKVCASTFYRWYPRYKKKGVDGLKTFESNAPKHHPHKKPKWLEDRVIALTKEHQDWGKRRIAHEIWKENDWERIISPTTVRTIQIRRGVWKREELEKKKREKAVVADEPDKTANIDLFFVPQSNEPSSDEESTEKTVIEDPDTGTKIEVTCTKSSEKKKFREREQKL